MGHCRLKIIFFSLFITTCFRYSNACRIVGTFPGVFYYGWVRDVDAGIIWRNETTDVIAITDYSLNDETSWLYLGVQLIDSKFELFTTEYFKDYEEYEVSQTMTVQVSYDCTGNNNMFPQLITIDVKDTNNNPPTFLPSNEYVINIAAPMPPGYEITGCGYGIIVRDIDLTTQKIIFEIEDNPYFEIEKEIHRNSSTPKEFKAIIRTKSFIRSFPEELKLTIWATDYDLTGDSPRTTEATIIIHGNRDFVLPEEPVFSETFYLADYTDDNRVVLTKPITLKSGYDELVQFNIKGDYTNFELFQDEENKISIRVVKPLAEAVLKQTNIHLIVTADRELTSGASATVVLRLPEAKVLKFEASLHRGSLQNKVLKLDPIRLAVGYDKSVVFTITGDYAKYFRITNGQNPAIITLKPCIPSAVILNNKIILLTVTASGFNAVTTTNVILDVIKDDRVVPKFSSSIYYGTYLDASNFNIQNIHLTQGFGSDVTFKLDGENTQYFGLSIKGNDVVVYPRSVIPQDVIFEKKVLVFNILAMKALTVGASAAISIRFPPHLTNPVILRFTQNIYTGTLERNAILALDGIIKLSAGYAPDTEFILTGEFSEHFNALLNEEGLTLTLLDILPVEARERAFIVLEIEARRERAVSAWTSVVIEVVRQEIVPPVFEQAYYRGAYNAESGLRFTQVISLSQGYDDTVTFFLEGAFVSRFALIMTSSNSLVISTPNPIPNEELQAHSQFLFAIVATKPGALTARSAVSIDIEKDLLDQVILKFTQNIYTGTLERNVLTVDGNIKLSAGYAPGTEFILTGEFSAHFKALPNEEVLTLTLLDALPVEARERAFLVLEIEARRERAVSAWTSVVIEVIRDEMIVVPPVIKLN